MKALYFRWFPENRNIVMIPTVFKQIRHVYIFLLERRENFFIYNLMFKIINERYSYTVPFCSDCRT